jgi:type IV secretory pathway TraG/TraD family ATPase VirD4
MPKLETKPLGWFKPDPNQPRKQFDEAELRLLGESLRKKQLQPVLAKTDGTLVAGERRYRAAMLVGLASLQVIVTDEPLTEAEVRLTKAVHVAVIAPTGCGKGTSFVIPHLLTCPDSMVVIDFKGENAKITAKHRREKFGHRTVILDRV